MKKIFISLFFLMFLVCNAFPQQISNDLKTLVSSEGKVLYGEEPNSIIVMDYPENINRIAEYLDAVDVSPQQVLIEARVVEVRLSSEKSLGVNWQMFGTNGARIGEYKIGSPQSEIVQPYFYQAPGIGGGAFPLNITQPETSRSFLKGALEQLIPYKSTTTPGGTTEEQPFQFSIFSEDINVILSALANAYDTHILSAPRVATVNNRAAEIRIVESLPWAEPSVNVNDSGFQTITWKVTFESVGITLQVTPTINEDGEITMLINPQVSEKVGDYTLTVTDSLGHQIPYAIPIIDTREASTKVVMKNGQTLILGGLIRNSIVKKESKIPFFGDLPVVGNLFKSQYDSKEKTELVIFVSPTIINANEMSRMAKLEQYGPGRMFAQDRQREAKMLTVLEKQDQEKKSKLSAQWDDLVKRQQGLAEETKKLKESVQSEEAAVKSLETQKQEMIRKRASASVSQNKP